MQSRTGKRSKEACAEACAQASNGQIGVVISFPTSGIKFFANCTSAKTVKLREGRAAEIIVLPSATSVANGHFLQLERAGFAIDHDACKKSKFAQSKSRPRRRRRRPPSTLRAAEIPASDTASARAARKNIDA